MKDYIICILDPAMWRNKAELGEQWINKYRKNLPTWSNANREMFG
jgi:hypothetical protein